MKRHTSVLTAVLVGALCALTGLTARAQPTDPSTGDSGTYTSWGPSALHTDSNVYADGWAYSSATLGALTPLTFNSNTLAQNDTMAVIVPFDGVVVAVSEDLFSGTLASTEAYNFTAATRFSANASQGSTPEITTTVTNAAFSENDVLGIRVLGSVSSPLEYTGVIWIQQTDVSTEQ